MKSKTYFIKVKGFFDAQTEGHPVTFRTVEEIDFDNEIKVLNKMLHKGEINSYEVYLDHGLECTCFRCDPDCEVLKEKNENPLVVKTGFGWIGA